MGRRHAKNIKNTAYTFEVAPREHYGGSREKRRHPEQYGLYMPITKKYQEAAQNGNKELPEM